MWNMDVSQEHDHHVIDEVSHEKKDQLQHRWISVSEKIIAHVLKGYKTHYSTQ